MSLSRRAFVAGVAGAASMVGITRSTLASPPGGTIEEIGAAVGTTGLSPAVRHFESRRATVTVFGDSIATGLGLIDNTRRWTDRLQVMLRRDSYTALMTIDNRAVSGQSIISEMPTYETGAAARFHRAYPEKVAGGRLLDHVGVVYPEGTPRERVPRIVVLVPSVNELIVSKQATATDRAVHAAAGVRMIHDHLLRIGVSRVIVVPMIPPAQRFDDALKIDAIEEAGIVNVHLAGTGLLTQVDYGLGRPGLYGSDDALFNAGYGPFNDGLHPGPAGHAAIAWAMFQMLRDVAIRL